MPVWRNGRRGGLKIPWQRCRVGSSPITGTKWTKEPTQVGFFVPRLSVGCNKLRVDAMATFLVIRCSNLDGVNPIEEVDQVIDRLGFCWFGKYGQPIGSIASQAKGDLKVVLTGGSKIGVQGTGAVYELRGWSFAPPLVEHYPQCYANKLSRIGTWLKLERTTETTISTGELIIKSSLQPLPKVLSDSMRGHFWCVRSRRNSGD